MALVLYLVFFLIFFVSNYTKYGFNGGSFIIALYGIGALLGVFVFVNTDFYEYERLNSAAAIYHIFCLLLFLYPLVYVSNKFATIFVLPNVMGLKIFSYTIFGFSFFTFLSILPKFKTVFSVGDLHAARNMYNYGQLYEESATDIIGYLGGIGSAFAYFSLYLFFYFLVKFPSKKKYIILFFLCSLTDALTSLSVVGRGGIMRWVLMFLFFYFTFKKFIDPILVKKVRKWLLIAVSPLLIIFSLITFSRFSNREYPLYIYIFDYIGQSYVYFSYIFDGFYESTFGGRMNFPILFPDDRVSRVLSEEVVTDYALNTFSTFVGSFYKDMGFWTTLIIAFIFWIIFIVSVRFNKRPNSFYKGLVWIIFSQILINGVFYFQYTGTTKIRLFCLIIIFGIYLQYRYPSGKKIV